MEIVKIEELIARIESCVTDLRGLSDAGLPPRVTAGLLAQAAALSEICGYLLARNENSQPITELMLISSRLDAMARNVGALA